MIKGLRKKFVVVAMCSVLAVLAVVICVINVVNYVNVVKNADDVIYMLQEGGGKFGLNGALSVGKPFSPETPYETRFFTVVVDADGNAVFVNDDFIAAISAQEAADMAEELFQKGKKDGFYGSYRYGAAAFGTGTMYIFVDCNKELTSFYNFLWTSIAVGAASLAVVLVLVLYFSDKVMRPVAESYSKQKRFITDASHEIKTPLTIISADADVLEQSGANEWTADIKRQVSRLSDLTSELVFLARMEEADNRINKTDFCISEAIGEAARPFNAVAQAREMELKTDFKSNLTYNGDETMIRQLASLLIDNAIKYSDGTVVEAALYGSGNKLTFTVKNRASYMRGDKLDDLFGRFYRRDASRNSETGGFGIGLSVAQSIVAAHKGRISARMDGDDVVFTVIL